MAEAYQVHTAQLRLYPGHADTYGPDVASRLAAAAEVGVTSYLDAVAFAQKVRASWLTALSRVDAILSPITSTAPSSIDRPDEVCVNNRWVTLRSAVMGFTVPQNVTGLPSVVFRAGRDDTGLPIGVQLTGPAWAELDLLDLVGPLDRTLTPSMQWPSMQSSERHSVTADPQPIPTES
jgi:Asp-tRNA(Asn)/Glu-tRNA(Gln) amidotransferase A subunit family amidase